MVNMETGPVTPTITKACPAKRLTMQPQIAVENITSKTPTSLSVSFWSKFAKVIAGPIDVKNIYKTLAETFRLKKSEKSEKYSGILFSKSSLIPTKGMLLGYDIVRLVVREAPRGEAGWGGESTNGVKWGEYNGD